MTTPNSLLSPPPQNGAAVTIEAPLDALSASYDIQDEPAPIDLKAIEDLAKPAPKPAPTPTPTPQAPAAVPATAPATAAPVPAPAAPEKRPSAHSASLLKRATDLGIHPIVIDRLNSSELSDLVFEQMSARLAAAAENSRAATVQSAAQAPAAPEPQKVEAASTPAEEQDRSWDWGEHQAYDEYGNPIAGKKMKYTDEMLNPALAHHIRAQAKRIEKLEKFISQVEQQQVTRHESRIERDFDEAFSLFPDTFGVGGAAAVRDNAELMERRKVTYAAVRAMFSTMPKEVAGKMTIKDGVVAMAKSLFGKDPKVEAASTPAVPPNHPGQRYAGAALAAPTNRQPSDLPLGEARAKEEIKAWWNENRESGTPQGGATTPDEFF